MKKAFLKLLFSLLLFLSGVYNAYSQDTHSLLLEPEFNVVLQNETPWSYSFGIAHRGILLKVYEEKKLSHYYTEHIELNHATGYSFNPQFNVALRVRYRFKEVFDDSRYDELRFIEEVEYQHANWRFQPEHRLRIEQRIENLLTHRFRYQLGVSQSITEEFAAKLATEALYSIAKDLKPTPEQRFEIGIKNTSFENFELGLSLEYRLDNYTREPEREYYILTGATLNL